MALALGALTLWHAALITRGETSIERHINKKERQRLQKKGKVSVGAGGQGAWGAGGHGQSPSRSPSLLPQAFRNPYSFGAWDNWRVFLGVDVPR